MVSPRRLLSGVAVGSAAVVLSAMLAGSASASPANGCQNENSGANGQTCTNVGSDLYPGVVAGLHLKLPVHAGVAVNVPSCPDARTALVEARVIVGGTNGKGGTSKRLGDAEAANNAAMKTLEAITKKYYPARQSASDAADALAKYDATHGVAPLPPVVAADRAALVKARDDTAATVKDLGQKYFDDSSAVYGPNGTKAALEAARKAEGAAEQGVVDAEVVIGQACKTPVVTPPAPPTDTPAPSQPVVISPALPSDGSAPAPVPVQASLPVTG